MADDDTLAGAEEKVLQRAQRKAVEEAGVYLESTFHDVEKESGGRSSQTSSLEIRTIAAAVTETKILESRRCFELDRPIFFVRIRATVNLSSLAEAIRRLQSDQQLAQHFRHLQQENHQLRSQLQEFQQQPIGVRMLVILKLNQPEHAIEDLSTVIRVDPTNAAALVTRAKLYRERLRGRLAKDDLERACVRGSIPACEQLP